MYERFLNWCGDHPFLTLGLFALVFVIVFGLAVQTGIITEHTKLMPY
jgi:uncharacterized membrane protein